MKKICFLLALILAFTLCGCESNLDKDRDDDDDDDRENTVTLTAEETLEEALQALTGGECGGYAVVLGADGKPAVPHNSGVAQLLSSYVTFEVKEFSSRKDTAEAALTITAPDASVLLRQVSQSVEAVDEETLYAQVEALLKQSPAMLDFNVTVQLVLTEEGWCVVPSFELSNALTGGLTQTYMQLQQELLAQLQKGGEAE